MTEGDKGLLNSSTMHPHENEDLRTRNLRSSRRRYEIVAGVTFVGLRSFAGISNPAYIYLITVSSLFISTLQMTRCLFYDKLGGGGAAKLLGGVSQIRFCSKPAILAGVTDRTR